MNLLLPLLALGAGAWFLTHKGQRIGWFPSNPPLPGGWQLAAGKSYNITQFVADVPNDAERQAIVRSLLDKGNTNVQIATIPKTEFKTGEDIAINYDSFPLPSSMVVPKEQKSKLGTYEATVLDIRDAGMPQYFEANKAYARAV